MDNETGSPAADNAVVETPKGDAITTSELASMLSRKRSSQPAPTPITALPDPKADNEPTETEAPPVLSKPETETTPATQDLELEEPTQEANEAALAAAEARETKDPPASKLPPELQEAIEAAALAPDRKTAIAKMSQRIHEVVDERKAIEAERDELRAKLAEKETAPAASAPNVDPVAMHPEVQRVSADLTTVNDNVSRLAAQINTAIRNGAETIAFTGPKGEPVEYPLETVQAYKQELENQRAGLIAERSALRVQVKQEMAQQRQHWDRIAAQQFPWQANAKAPERDLEKQVVSRFPGIKSIEDGNWWLGVVVAGLQAIKKPAATAAITPARVKPATVPTPMVGRPANVAPKTDPVKMKIADARAEFEKTGDPKALARLRSLQRQAA